MHQAGSAVHLDDSAVPPDGSADLPLEDHRGAQVRLVSRAHHLDAGDRHRGGEACCCSTWVRTALVRVVARKDEQRSHQ